MLPNTMSSEPEQTLIVRIAIFASGRGSNAERIINYFAGHPDIEVALIVTNKPDAGVLLHAAAHHIPAVVMTGRQLRAQIIPEEFLQCRKIDFIVLAGFMILIPAWLVNAYPHRIVNIHPALLPKYGGKGMYGMHVHNAVKAAGEHSSGITIHYVNEVYDEGAVIAQYDTTLHPTDSSLDIARKVQILEHRYYPEVIEGVIRREILVKRSQSDN
jgi:phosphoribosylglycinamide formyltransferase-1